MRVKSIRCGKGLGDALYLQSVVRHLVEKGQKLNVACNWNDVFIPLKDKVKVIPFTRENIDILAHYSLRKPFDTKQFDDCCIQAGIKEKADLRLDWEIQDKEFVNKLKGDKPILLVLIYRLPMDRLDGFAKELLPNINVIQSAINRFKDTHRIVLCGSGKAINNYQGVDIDLTNKTSVSQLFDLAYISDLMLGYCSFFVPLAESLNKKALFVWSAKGLKSDTLYIKRITPEKILYKETSKFVIDNWSQEKINEVISELM
jgi:hypothetical protein